LLGGFGPVISADCPGSLSTTFSETCSLAASSRGAQLEKHSAKQTTNSNNPKLRIELGVDGGAF
jgi:hypothetical protein